MIQNLLTAKVIEKKNPWKKSFGISWKIIKILIILFLIVVSLWGCGQQFFDDSVRTYNLPGSGLEICANKKFAINNHNIVNGAEVFYTSITSFSQALSYGPFFAFFVYPISILTDIMLLSFSGGPANGVPNIWATFGTIFLVVLLIKLIVLPTSIQQFKQQILMQKIQNKAAEIKVKYQGVKGMKEKQQMQMELMQLNKKFGVKPMASIVSIFVTLPFIYSMYRAFSSIRIIKYAYLWNPKYLLSYTPFSAVFSHHYYVYFVIMIIIIPIQILQFKIPTILAKKTMVNIQVTEKVKKSQKNQRVMSNVLMVVYALIGLNISTSLSIYWIFTGVFSIIQSIVVWKYMNKKQGIYKKVIDWDQIDLKYSFRQFVIKWKGRFLKMKHFFKKKPKKWTE